MSLLYLHLSGDKQRAKNYIILKSIALLPLFLTFSLYAGPRLSVIAPEYDFGAVKGEPIIQHRFAIENKGDKTLVIRRIHTSCGCTTSNVRQMTLDPGEIKELPVKMDLKGRSGKQRQVITLHTNDPDRRVYPLKVSGEVVPVIQIVPRTLNLLHIDPENPKVGTVTLTSTDGTPFKITEIDTVNERVSTEVTHAEDGLSATVEITPLPQKGQGHFTDVLLIDTTNDKILGKRVLVMWQIQSGVSISPGSLNLIPAGNPPPQQRYIMIKPPPDQKEGFQVTDVSWPGREEMKMKLTETPFGWRVHIQDLVPLAEMAGEEIIFTTNLEGFETLKIPVRVLEK